MFVGLWVRAPILVLGVLGMATNSVRHVAARGVLGSWLDADGLICDVRAAGGSPSAARRPRPPRLGQAGGWGLWLGHRCAPLSSAPPRRSVVRLRPRL